MLLRHPRASDFTLILTLQSGIQVLGVPVSKKDEHKSLAQYLSGMSESVKRPIFPT